MAVPAAPMAPAMEQVLNGMNIYIHDYIRKSVEATICKSVYIVQLHTVGYSCIQFIGFLHQLKQQLHQP